MERKMIKIFSFRNVFLVLTSFVVCLGFILYDTKYALFTVSAVLIMWLSYYVFNVLSQVRWMKIAHFVLTEQKQNLSTYVDTATIPLALTDSKNTIRWQNAAFTALVGNIYVGKDIYQIVPNIDKPSKDRSIMIDDHKFIKEAYPQSYKHLDLVLHRLVDPLVDIESSSLYRKHLSVVSIVQIDNFDEIAGTTENISSAEISFEIEKELYSFARPIKGLLKKYDRDKYLLVFERKYLASMIQSKFEILDKISTLNIHGARPTISIAVGVSNDLYDSLTAANKALELALGRGGNQAVIKRKDKFSFLRRPPRAALSGRLRLNRVCSAMR